MIDAYMRLHWRVLIDAFVRVPAWYALASLAPLVEKGERACVDYRRVSLRWRPSAWPGAATDVAVSPGLHSPAFEEERIARDVQAIGSKLAFVGRWRGARNREWVCGHLRKWYE